MRWSHICKIMQWWLKQPWQAKLVLLFLFYIYLEALTRRREKKSFVLVYSVINAQYSLWRLALLCLALLCLSSAQWVCRKSRAARSGSPSSPSSHLSSQQSQPPLTLAPSSHLFLVYWSSFSSKFSCKCKPPLVQLTTSRYTNTFLYIRVVSFTHGY